MRKTGLFSKNEHTQDIQLVSLDSFVPADETVYGHSADGTLLRTQVHGTMDFGTSDNFEKWDRLKILFERDRIVKNMFNFQKVLGPDTSQDIFKAENKFYPVNYMCYIEYLMDRATDQCKRVEFNKVDAKTGLFKFLDAKITNPEHMVPVDAFRTEYKKLLIPLEIQYVNEKNVNETRMIFDLEYMGLYNEAFGNDYKKLFCENDRDYGRLLYPKNMNIPLEIVKILKQQYLEEEYKQILLNAISKLSFVKTIKDLAYAAVRYACMNNELIEYYINQNPKICIAEILFLTAGILITFALGTELNKETAKRLMNLMKMVDTNKPINIELNHFHIGYMFALLSNAKCINVFKARVYEASALKDTDKIDLNNPYFDDLKNLINEYNTKIINFINTPGAENLNPDTTRIPVESYWILNNYCRDDIVISEVGLSENPIDRERQIAERTVKAAGVYRFVYALFIRKHEDQHYMGLMNNFLGYLLYGYMKLNSSDVVKRNYIKIILYIQDEEQKEFICGKLLNMQQFNNIYVDVVVSEDLNYSIAFNNTIDAAYKLCYNDALHATSSARFKGDTDDVFKDFMKRTVCIVQDMFNILTSFYMNSDLAAPAAQQVFELSADRQEEFPILKLLNIMKFAEGTFCNKHETSMETERYDKPEIDSDNRMYYVTDVLNNYLYKSSIVTKTNIRTEFHDCLCVSYNGLGEMFDPCSLIWNLYNIHKFDFALPSVVTGIEPNDLVMNTIRAYCNMYGRNDLFLNCIHSISPGCGGTKQFLDIIYPNETVDNLYVNRKDYPKYNEAYAERFITAILQQNGILPYDFLVLSQQNRKEWGDLSKGVIYNRFRNILFDRTAVDSRTNVNFVHHDSLVQVIRNIPVNWDGERTTETLYIFRNGYSKYRNHKLITAREIEEGKVEYVDDIGRELDKDKYDISDDKDVNDTFGKYNTEIQERINVDIDGEDVQIDPVYRMYGGSSISARDILTYVCYAAVMILIVILIIRVVSVIVQESTAESYIAKRRISKNNSRRNVKRKI